MSVEVSLAHPVDERNARCYMFDKRLEPFAEVTEIVSVLADAISADYDGRAAADAGKGERLRKVVGRVGALIAPAGEGPDVCTMPLPETCNSTAAIDIGDLCGERHVNVEGAVDLGDSGEPLNPPQAFVGLNEGICELKVFLKEDAHLGVSRIAAGL